MEENLAFRIIHTFSNFHERPSRETIKRLVKEWIELPKEVKDQYKEVMPYWLCAYLRRLDNKRIVARKCKEDGANTRVSTFLGFEEKSIAYSEFPDRVWEDENLFNEWCEDYHIYGTQNRKEIFNSYHESQRRIHRTGN